MLEIIKIRKDINWLIEQIKCLIKKGEGNNPDPSLVTLAATEWSANHSVSTGDAYPIDCLVWLGGNIYKSLINNNVYNPTNITYWQNLGEGSLLLEEQSNWDSITGRSNIKNKPTKLSDFENDTDFITIADVPSLGFTPENVANKQTDLTASATKYPTINAVNSGLDLKVDKVIGKGLSTNDYTTTEQTKVSNLSGTNTGDETTSTILTKIGNGTVINQSCLPSYVDDVLEFSSVSGFPTVGEVGKIYIAVFPSNSQYRWTGSNYTQITNGFIASTNDVPEGINNKYFTESRVLNTLLTGISFITGTTVTATDNVLVGFGKIQKQISDALTTISGLMVKTNNGSDINNIATFRTNLGIEKIKTVGNISYTILNTDKVVVTSVSFTTSRTWNLPLANTVNAGYEIIIADLFGAVTSVNTLVITTNGSDTTNGTTSVTIGAAYGMRRFISDGVSTWTFDGGVMRISDYIGTTLTPSTIVATDSNSKLRPLTDVILGSFLNSLTTKSTIVNNDLFNIVDSADSNKQKKVLFSVLKAMVLANPALTGLATLVGPTATLGTDVLVDLTQTWNTTSTPTGIRLSVTETITASNSSMLLDFKVNNVTVFSVSKVGAVYIGGSVSLVNAIIQSVWESSGTNAPSRLRFKGTNSTGTSTPRGLIVENAGSSNVINNSTGTFDLISTDTNFTPTSGTGSFTFLIMNNTINQTGGANGIVRFLYCNPTLTSLIGDFRALDITSGSIVLPYLGVSANYTIKSSDYLINVTSGVVTTTLPTAVGCTGKHYIIKNTGVSVVTVATTSSQTIDGAATVSLGVVNKYVHVVSTGANWIIIANN